MKRYFFLAILIMSVCVFASCSQKKTETASGNFVEKVFVVNIAEGGQVLQEYLRYHEKVWPEVEAGFKKAGYKKIVLYRFDHLLVMTIKAPEGADLGAMGKLAEAYSPRCAEWNKLMDSYQRGVPGAAPGEKWVEAKPFYQFDN